MQYGNVWRNLRESQFVGLPFEGGMIKNGWED